MMGKQAMYSAPPKLSTSTLVSASTKVEEVMKNKLLGNAQKAFKGHVVMEDEEKVHIPDTLKDSNLRVIPLVKG